MGKGNKQYYEFSNYIEETNNEHDSKNKIKIFIIVVILILFIGLILIAMNVKQTIDISKSQKEIAENLNAVSNKTTRLDEEKAKLEEEATVVQFTEKIGPDGRTFGSITNKKIAEELEKQFGIKIDKRHIQVSSPIRSTGLIDVPVKIYQDVTGVINIRVNEG